MRLVAKPCYFIHDTREEQENGLQLNTAKGAEE